MRRYARTLAVILGLGTLFFAPASRADDVPPTVDSATEARTQYQQGTQAFQQKRYSEAALHFEAAASFRTSAVALYTAGLAWDNASRPERAADAYGRSLEVGGLDPKQAGLAKDRVTQLEKTLGTLAVSAPEGWKVQLDTFTEVPTPARLHGSPGVHALSIRAPGRPIERRDVSLDAGKVTNLELKDETKVAPKPEPEPEPEPPPPPPVVVETPPPYWITRRVVGVGVGSVGVATLIATVVLGVNANDAKVAYDAGPTRESFDHASSLQTWTNVTLVTSLLCLAGGVALVVWPDKDGERGVRVGPAPGGGVVTGTF
ncbi:MAG: hypothetical protein KF819_37515 [Labilithrix sp.]|nr:hypothetical protein [Labilithrix sp.]